VLPQVAQQGAETFMPIYLLENSRCHSTDNHYQILFR